MFIRDNPCIRPWGIVSNGANVTVVAEKKPASKRKPKDNSAAIAKQFGVSLKALRLYEQRGLLKPPRNAAGWRVYGQVEIECLHVILSLKQLGLSLARIAEILKSGAADISEMLAIQEQVLAEARAETEYALKLVTIARQRLKENQSLSGDDLARLVRSIDATIVRWTPDIDALAKRIFTPEQLAKVRPSDRSPEELAAASRFWEVFIADLTALPADCDPASDEALELGRRFVAHTQILAGGDKELWNSNARFWQEALGDPNITLQLRENMPRAELFGRILGELNSRGEIDFQ